MLWLMAERDRRVHQQKMVSWALGIQVNNMICCVVRFSVSVACRDTRCTEAYCVHKHTCKNIIHNCKLKIWACKYKCILFAHTDTLHIACRHWSHKKMHTVQTPWCILCKGRCTLWKGRCTLCITYDAYCTNAMLHIVQMLRCILCKHCDLNCANAVQRRTHIVRTNSRRTHTDGR